MAIGHVPQGAASAALRAIRRHNEVRALLEKTPGVERVLDGNGTAAPAAAKVKPGGDTGVVIDDYAEQPITQTKVVRSM